MATDEGLIQCLDCRIEVPQHSPKGLIKECLIAIEQVLERYPELKKFAVEEVARKIFQSRQSNTTPEY